MNRYEVRLKKLEAVNSPSFENIDKEYQKIFTHKIHAAVVRREKADLTERDKRICELYEQMVRVEPVLYEKSLYRIIDLRREEK